jgi:hypothetical protein
MIRKSVFTVALVLLFVFAGTALAKTVFFKGNGTDDPKVKVKFDVVGPKDPRHGGINLEDARVEEFAITGVTQTITCQGVETERPVGYFFEDSIDVQEDGDFSGKEKVPGAGGQTARVKGQFDRGFVAKGRFRLSGDAGGCTIETGRVGWEATDLGGP